MKQQIASTSTFSRRASRILEVLMGLGVLMVGLTFLRILYASPPPYGDPGSMGSAAFFPGLVALLVSGVGVVLVIIALRPNFPAPVASGQTPRALLAYALITMVAVGLPWLGIWLTAMLAVPLMAMLFGERRWIILLILAAVPPSLIIHLFEGVLGIYFPRGILL